jgi:hypothetical protein
VDHLADLGVGHRQAHEGAVVLAEEEAPGGWDEGRHEPPLGEDVEHALDAGPAAELLDPRQVLGDPPVADAPEDPSEETIALPPELLQESEGKLLVGLGEQMVGGRGEGVDHARPAPPAAQAVVAHEAFGPKGCQVGPDGGPGEVQPRGEVVDRQSPSVSERFEDLTAGLLHRGCLLDYRYCNTSG